MTPVFLHSADPFCACFGGPRLCCVFVCCLFARTLERRTPVCSPDRSWSTTGPTETACLPTARAFRRTSWTHSLVRWATSNFPRARPWVPSYMVWSLVAAFALFRHNSGPQNLNHEPAQQTYHPELCLLLKSDSPEWLRAWAGWSCAQTRVVVCLEYPLRWLSLFGTSKWYQTLAKLMLEVFLTSHRFGWVYCTTRRQPAVHEQNE